MGLGGARRCWNLNDEVKPPAVRVRTREFEGAQPGDLRRTDGRASPGPLQDAAAADSAPGRAGQPAGVARNPHAHRASSTTAGPAGARAGARAGVTAGPRAGVSSGDSGPVCAGHHDRDLTLNDCQSESGDFKPGPGPGRPQGRSLRSDIVETWTLQSLLTSSPAFRASLCGDSEIITAIET